MTQSGGSTPPSRRPELPSRHHDRPGDLFAELEELTEALQHLLLPPRMPDIGGVELASCYLPASRSQVGGDFFDLFPLGGGAWGIAIGDVCGKGPAAATVAAAARHALRAAAIDRRQPSEVLAVLNETLIIDNDDEAEPRFCTAVYGRLRPYRDGFRITVACAGHPSPFLVRPDGGVADLGATGTLLGVVPDAEFNDQRLYLRRGETVVMFTDGLTEADAGGGELLGRHGIRSVLASVGDRPLPELVGALRERALVSRDQRDDLAILAVRPQAD